MSIPKTYSLATESIEPTKTIFRWTGSSNSETLVVDVYKNGVLLSAFPDPLDLTVTINGGKTYSIELYNMSAGTKYEIRTTPVSNDSFGAVTSLKFTTPKSGSAKTVESYKDPNDASKAETKSLLKLSNPYKDRKKYIIAEKDMDKLDKTKEYYSFGTTLFMKASADTVLNSGGLMFFSSRYGLDGYYISVQSADSADLYQQNPFRILKIQNGKVSKILDSQDSKGGKKFGAIFNGESYRIDVFVKASATRVDITAYINGFLISASDITSTDLDAATSPNYVIVPTELVSLVAAQGTMYFDYVYAKNITKSDFANRSKFSVDISSLSSSIINSAFGEKVLSNPVAEDSNINVEEFGTVAREIRPYKFQYANPPAFPRYATTGGNSQVSILSQQLTSHGAELYVMNNSGTYIPLADGDSNSLWVIGKRILRTGEIEYVDDSAGKFSTPRPVIFNSAWLQNNQDVTSLAQWIKTVWSKKQSIVKMAVTGNPLLSVGDIITIKYDYHGFDGTQKFVITAIEQSFATGIDTAITCRTL